MAKKAAPKKAAKPVKKVAAKKPVKKTAPVKKVAPKKAAKPVKKAAPAKAKPVAKKKAAPVKKVSKPAPKAPAKKVAAPVAKKPATSTKQVIAKPAPKAPAKAVAKAPAKAVAPTKPAPVAKAVPAPKSAPAPKPAPSKAAKPAPKATVKKEKEEKAPPKPLVTQVSAPVIHKSAPMVKKQVSTLEAASKERYTDTELEEFKGIINAKLDEARKDYELLKQTLANNDNNGTEDTSPSFKMIEDGSETLSREETAQLAARQEKFIKHLEDALLRIRNKTYGICRVTGRLISKERLRLVPHATLSIEAKQQMGS
jgi:RNA polymerase-binding transcription factor DksA